MSMYACPAQGVGLQKRAEHLEWWETEVETGESEQEEVHPYDSLAAMEEPVDTSKHWQQSIRALIY